MTNNNEQIFLEISQDLWINIIEYIKPDFAFLLRFRRVNKFFFTLVQNRKWILKKNRETFDFYFKNPKLKKFYYKRFQDYSNNTGEFLQNFQMFFFRSNFFDKNRKELISEALQKHRSIGHFNVVMLINNLDEAPSEVREMLFNYLENRNYWKISAF